MQSQGPINVHSHVSQDPFFKPYEPKGYVKTVENLPSHLKPTSKQVEESAASSILNKVEVLDKPIASVYRNNKNLDFFPSRFNHDMNDSYALGIKTKQAYYLQLIKQDTKNCNLRLQLAENSLLFAEIFDALLEEEEKAEKVNEQEVKLLIDKLNDFLNLAKKENLQVQLLNPFHPRHYYIESLIMEFEGVNCRNLEQVEKYIMLLKIALALDPTPPTSTEAQQTFEEAITFFRSRWAELLQEETIDNATYLEWTAKLNEWLSNDTLKIFFANNPRLFKLATQAQHAEFFNKHPELKSVEAFVKKYPDLGAINLPGGLLTKESVREALAQAEDDPLAIKLGLISPIAILTPIVADEIRKAMLNYSSKQKMLKIYVGNEDDVNTIANSFRGDQSLLKNKGSLTDEVVTMHIYPFPVHSVYITPDNPYLRT
jgi:hypothetical protein